MGYRSFGVDIIVAALSPLPMVVGVDCVWYAPPTAVVDYERTAVRVMYSPPAGGGV